MTRGILVARTSDSRFVVAIWSQLGFAFYRVFKDSPYFRNKIRKTAVAYNVMLASDIDWENLPKGDAIEIGADGAAKIRERRAAS